MTKILSTTMLLLLTLIASGQEVQRCGTTEFHEQKMLDPDYAKAHQEKMIKFKQHALESVNKKSQMCTSTIYLPVAVHFQGSGLTENCAIDMAVSQLEALNADFAATNFDIDLWNDTYNGQFPGTNNQASCIQFCLATLNHPDGYGLANGDYAVTVDATTGDNSAAWSGYINFFVRDLGGGVLGYSPLGGNGNGDGIACDIGTFGLVDCDGNTINAPYNLGRTMTHEVGHYLLLEHPWGGGGCMSTDDIADTPVTGNSTFGCPNDEVITCTDPVLWMSYMDYCDDLCLFMFSAGQVDRMETYVDGNLQHLIDNGTIVCQESACIGFSGSVSKENESCAGGDGSINLSTINGNAPFQYSINDGAINQVSPDFIGLGEGSYDVLITDAEGCEFSTTTSLTRADAVINVLNNDPAFCGDASGIIEVDVDSPGTFLYSLDDGPGQTSGLFDEVEGGTHVISVVNQTGCSGLRIIDVDDENDLGIEIDDINPVNCFFYDNGSIAFHLDGGVPPIWYELDMNEDSTQTPLFEFISVGDHIITVRDDRGCRAKIPFFISRNTTSLSEDCPCTMYAPNAFTADNDGNNDYFQVFPSCPVKDFSLEIFSRYGELIFETNDVNEKWNGSAGSDYYAEPEIFFFKMTYSWGGQGDVALSHEESGSVVIIR